jgi:oxygen-independent coproporphyrinogen III oxidase
MQVPYPASELVIDPVLIRSYDVSGPRYTSYPTADRFVEAFGEAQLTQWLEKRNIGGISQPLSVYVHLPFCDTVCYYCGCNKVVTKDHSRSSKYINYLEDELALLEPRLGASRAISELHWGGGTPTFLSHDEMSRLMCALDARFKRGPRTDCSLEVDPRKVAAGTMKFLAGLGFTRVSIGVQDFDPAVQKAVNRIQSVEVTRRVTEEARESGFRSVNFDLIYGLPKQTLDSFNRTLDGVLELNPDRVALYSYAHLPKLFIPQRRIAEADLPTPEAKLQIMTLAIGRLTRAGYLYIGMDHFARPSDDLAQAQALGQLKRSFQGYSTHPGDILGLGVSAIGQVGPTYYQNWKTLAGYYAALDAGRLPVMRGLELTPEDLVRRAVIQALTCHFRVSIESIELAYLIDFRKYFAAELADLRRLAREGLVELDSDWIIVTPRGRLLVRAVCMVFDRYLRERETRAGYSKVI